MLRSDRHETARRIAELASYYDSEVFSQSRGFVCRAGASCRDSAMRRQGVGFYPAQGIAVGHDYDLLEDGVPLRVLVIGMETGQQRSNVTIAERTAEVRQLVAAPFKTREWNPHMRGVAHALRLAFRLPVGDDDAGLWLSLGDEAVHVLDTYAMTNLLLCSSVVLGTKKSKATPVMRVNCASHLLATMRVLQPTLVISQGATLSAPLARVFGLVELHSTTLSTRSVEGRQFLWADLVHPTRNWEWLSRPYLNDVVAPTLQGARHRALALARGQTDR